MVPNMILWHQLSFLILYSSGNTGVASNWAVEAIPSTSSRWVCAKSVYPFLLQVAWRIFTLPSTCGISITWNHKTWPWLLPHCEKAIPKLRECFKQVETEVWAKAGKNFTKPGNDLLEVPCTSSKTVSSWVVMYYPFRRWVPQLGLLHFSWKIGSLLRAQKWTKNEVPQGTLLLGHFLAKWTIKYHDLVKVNQNFMKSEANRTAGLTSASVISTMLKGAKQTTAAAEQIQEVSFTP